jgi:hypothetical protein
MTRCIVILFLILTCWLSGCTTYEPIRLPFDWSHAVSGKDYAPEIFLVVLKEGFTSGEENVVMNKLISGIGVIKDVRYYPDGHQYVVKITNGMTVKEAIEKVKDDLRVKTAWPEVYLQTGFE